jgi:hypothetical protein
VKCPCGRRIRNNRHDRCYVCRGQREKVRLSLREPDGHEERILAHMARVGAVIARRVKEYPAERNRGGRPKQEASR